MGDTVRVIFPNQDLEVFVEKGSTVGAACSRAGFALDYVCGGKGTCKKCGVEIDVGGERKQVLACQTKVEEHLSVFLTDKHIGRKANILTSSELHDVEFDPAIKKVFYKKEKLPPCSSGWEHLAVEGSVNPPSLYILQKFSELGTDDIIEGYTLVFWKNNIIDIEAGNTVYDAYGIAIDIGTTTIAAYVYDLITGKNIGTYSDLNGQVSEGADVITRIVACISNPAGLKTLQKKVVSTINGLIKNAVAEHQISSKNIYSVALCGNSAMQHLFLGLHPDNLGRAPFTSVVQRDVVTEAGDLGLNINPRGVVHFLPLIGGFVGADTTSVLLSLLHGEDKMRLIIDIGTNGEMVLGRKGKMLAASTAAGPALEGAGIKFGMRGTNGAIERVSLSEGKVEIKVIMKEKPLGICGSGLIDAVAEMLKAGIIDSRGRLQSKEAFLSKADPKYADLADNLENIENQNAFILAGEDETQSGGKIYISQKDIRAVQLAKGAIYTGSRLLIKEYGITGEDIDEILIAGAFGNYIDVKKGQYIGLLPFYEGVPVRSIGNAAGAGVQAFLLSKKIQNETLPLTGDICHLELASNPNFHEEYFKNLNFPKH